MRAVVAVVCALGMMLTSGTAMAQGPMLRKPLQELSEAIGKWASKQTGREAARELTDAGGEAVARRVGRKLLAGGGEEALERATRLTAEHGGAVLRAADNLPNPAPVLKAVEALPAAQASVALARLAAVPRDESWRRRSRNGELRRCVRRCPIQESEAGW